MSKCPNCGTRTRKMTQAELAAEEGKEYDSVDDIHTIVPVAEEEAADLRRQLSEAQGEMEAIRYAAHMPPDYEYGLPSWINQKLYCRLLEVTDKDGNPIHYLEDKAKIQKLEKELAEAQAQANDLEQQCQQHVKITLATYERADKAEKQLAEMTAEQDGMVDLYTTACQERLEMQGRAEVAEQVLDGVLKEVERLRGLEIAVRHYHEGHGYIERSQRWQAVRALLEGQQKGGEG